MHLEAPAKINLWLRVLGRREDGFHEIESLFLPLNLADTIELERTEGREVVFQCDDPSLPADGDNLVLKAAALFRKATGHEQGVRISLRKVIPQGAGLGGGSSDAAATLRGLNALFAAGLDEAALVRLAAQLGSDVPFFVRGRPALCRGRGERIEPADFARKLPLLLLKPPFAVPTPWAYRQWRDSREVPGAPYKAQEFDWGELVNDLERPVFEKFIVLAHLKAWLLEQPEAAGALLSGSGATVFAVLRDATEGEPLAVRAKAMFGETLWTRAALAG